MPALLTRTSSGAERGLGAPIARSQSLGGGDVEVAVDRVVAGGAERFGARLALGVSDVGEHDPGPLAAEELGLRGALAPGRAGDQRNLPRQAPHASR